MENIEQIIKFEDEIIVYKNMEKMYIINKNFEVDIMGSENPEKEKEEITKIVHYLKKILNDMNL